MFLNRWKMAISKRCIFSTKDGRIVAFPCGPFAAYLVPDAKSQSLVENSLLWRAVLSIPVLVATIVAIKIYTLSFYLLLLPIALDFIIFIPLVWFITRKWVRLPITRSLQACAAVQNLSALYENSYRFTFATILFTLPLFLLSINPVWYVIPIGFLFLSLVNWYLVILRHQDQTAP